MSMRKAIITGVISNEINTTPTSTGTARARFDVAVNEVVKGNRVTTYIPCTTYDKYHISLLEKNFFKGKAIEVEGKIRPYRYTAADGSTRKGFDVVIDSIGFVPGGSREKTEDAQAEAQVDDGADAAEENVEDKPED